MTGNNTEKNIADKLLKTALYEELKEEMELLEREVSEENIEFSDSFMKNIAELTDEACRDEERTADTSEERGSEKRKIIRLPLRRSLAAVASVAVVAGGAFALTRVMPFSGASGASADNEVTVAAATELMEAAADSGGTSVMRSETEAYETGAGISESEAFEAATDTEAGGFAAPSPASARAFSSDTKEDKASIGNPLREVEGSEAFKEQLGIDLFVDEERAQVPSYSIISDITAQICYYSEALGSDVRLRAAAESAGIEGEELAGVYFEFEEKKEVKLELPDGESQQISVEFTSESQQKEKDDSEEDLRGALLTWTSEGTNYSLWVEGTAGADKELTEEAEMVVEASEKQGLLN